MQRYIQPWWRGPRQTSQRWIPLAAPAFRGFRSVWRLKTLKLLVGCFASIRSGFAPCDSVTFRRLIRYFRPYEKKRGDRRSGSAALGSAWMTVFFAGLFFVGWCFLAVTFTMLALPEWQASRRYQSAVCTVEAVQVEQGKRSGLSTYRPIYLLKYEVDGKEYRGWQTYDVTGGYFLNQARCQELIDAFEPGQSYRCWYDPQAPESAVLSLGLTNQVWLLLLLPSGLIIVGGVGLAWRLVNWRTSAERRASLAHRAASLSAGERSVIGGEFPYVPPGQNLTDSPGTWLAFRLPRTGTAVAAAWALVAGCLIWNALVCVFVTLVVRDFLAGNFNWTLLLVTLAYTGIGIWLAVVCIRQVIRATHLGRSIVEISTHPLQPGMSCRLYVAQFGRARLRYLNVLLVSEEKATYQQGTNTRVEHCRVYSQEVLSQRHLEVRRGAPFEAQVELTVPATAMHSFRSPHNEVTWKIVVLGRARGWPRFERTFPLVIFPGPENAA